MTFTLSNDKGYILYNGTEIKECIRISYNLLSIDERIETRKASFKSDLDYLTWMIYECDSLLNYTLIYEE